MNPGKIIGGLFGVFFAIAGPLALGYAGFWWAMDRPAWHVGWCPVCVGWRAGANVQIATCRAAFAKEQTAFNTEKAALDGQNAAVLAMKATSDAWQARSVKAVQQASGAQAWRLRTADSILRQTLPADTSEIDQCRAAETMLRGAAR